MAACGVAVPGLVHVHRQGGAAFEPACDLADVGHVLRRGAGANLHLENAVALLLQPQLGLFEVAAHITAGQRPGQRQAVVALAAQQLPGRQAQRARHCVDQGHFHGALGKGVALAGHIHASQRGLKTGTVLPEQRRRQVILDGVLNALGRFFIPRRPADGGRLTEAASTMAQPQLHDHRALPADGAERELVRPDGGNVQNAGLDAFDGPAGVGLRGGRGVHRCGGSAGNERAPGDGFQALHGHEGLAYARADRHANDLFRMDHSILSNDWLPSPRWKSASFATFLTSPAPST